MKAREQMIDIIRGAIATRTGCTKEVAAVAADEVFAALQAPGREYGQRCLDAQEAADAVGAEILEALKNQLLIVFVNRLGGKLVVPVGEIDGTGGFMMSLAVDAPRGVFTFETRRKT